MSRQHEISSKCCALELRLNTRKAELENSRSFHYDLCHQTFSTAHYQFYVKMFTIFRAQGVENDKINAHQKDD